MFCSSSYETFDSHVRCVHHSQFVMARKEGVKFAKQKGYDASYLKNNIYAAESKKEDALIIQH